VCRWSLPGTSAYTSFSTLGLRVARSGQAGEPSSPDIRPDHLPVLEQLRALLDRYVPSPYPARWVASKLLEGDAEISSLMRKPLRRGLVVGRGAAARARDAFLAVASGRYEWIRRMTQAPSFVREPGASGSPSGSTPLPHTPFLGLLTLAAVLATIFGATYALGGPCRDGLARTLSAISRDLRPPGPVRAHSGCVVWSWTASWWRRHDADLCAHLAIFSRPWGCWKTWATWRVLAYVA